MIDRSTGQNKNIVNILPFGWIREPTRYASIAKDSTGHRAWLRVMPCLGISRRGTLYIHTFRISQAPC